MSKYTLDFKYQAVQHYRRVRSQQRTADHFNISRTHLRRRIAVTTKAASAHRSIRRPL